MAIQRYPVKHSSNIKSIGFDSGEEILEVEFGNGGVYRYKNVTAGLHADLMAAPSKGKFLSANITGKAVRDKFPFEKV